MKKIELLAPAGDMNCLKAAIEAGCDAVYIGGKRFGARSFAGNFSNDEIIEAINYAHLYGVKVYVTINIIVYESETEDFINYVRFLHKNNVDAVIIEDIGMMDLIRKKFPNLELHASTQMNVHNYEGAKLLNTLGIKRVVMARETELDVIKKIKEDLDIEVEVFIHGALCVCYSGQCLMSYLIGGRSGNRGTCAQVCRKSFNLFDENNKKLNQDNYLLSTKDLYTLENIDKIIDSGIDSLKIEGRMKRKEYVYLIVSIYRKVIDNYLNIGKVVVTEEDKRNIYLIFNRKFTKGFMLGEDNNNFVNNFRPNHQGIEIGRVIYSNNGLVKIELCDTVSVKDGLRFICDNEDYGLVINKMFINNKLVNVANKKDIISVKYDYDIKVGSVVVKTTDNKMIEDINDRLNNLSRKVLINLEVKAKLNDNLIVKASDGVNTASFKSDFIITKSVNRALDKKLLEKQMSKTGNTVYKVNNIDISLDEDIFINIKDINEARRKVLVTLDELRLYKSDFLEKQYFISLPDFKAEKLNSIEISTKEEYEQNKDLYDVIYTENKELLDNDKVIYKLPRIINDYKDYEKKVLVSELGSLIKYNNVSTDFSFNVSNSYSAAFLHSLNVSRVTLSYELTINQIEKLVKAYKSRYNKKPNLEVIVDSYPEAMVCKFDLTKMYNVNKAYLQDMYNNKYKVVSFKDYMKIYNYKEIKIDNKNHLHDIGINSLRVIL